VTAAPFLTCCEFLPPMIEAGDGCIVNIASRAGVRGGRRRAAYSAPKGGLVLLTKSLEIDHGPDGGRYLHDAVLMVDGGVTA
jgi:NAD(P)-dependent dehydrogenase (short-subunit alcohol dehydrogenase family)